MVQNLVFTILNERDHSSFPSFEECRRFGTQVVNPFPDIDLNIDCNDFRQFASPLDPSVDVHGNEWKSKGVMRRYYEKPTRLRIRLKDGRAVDQTVDQ